MCILDGFATVAADAVLVHGGRPGAVLRARVGGVSAGRATGGKFAGKQVALRRLHRGTIAGRGEKLSQEYQ